MNYDVDEAIEILKGTPAVLRTLLGDLSETWTGRNYGEGTFSPYDVVGHLIHGERTDWIPRMRIILERGEDRVFEPFDRFAQYGESRGKTLGQLLDAFAELRAETVSVLAATPLTPEVLARRGQHPDLGTVTLENLLATWVVHDLAHVSQICRAMAFQYRDAVGPWRAYISVLP